MIYNPISANPGSHPARGAWIEILLKRKCDAVAVSHPARGAWIEISRVMVLLPPPFVAPRKGCVD